MKEQKMGAPLSQRESYEEAPLTFARQKGYIEDFHVINFMPGEEERSNTWKPQ